MHVEMGQSMFMVPSVGVMRAQTNSSLDAPRPGCLNEGIHLNFSPLTIN